MPRATRSEIDTLLQEVRAIELLADETEVAPGDLQAYWDVSTDLIGLGLDIEEFASSHPDIGVDDPGLLDFRRRLRQIAARLTEMALE